MSNNAVRLVKIKTSVNDNPRMKLGYDKLQCLLSFTLSKIAVSFVLWFQDYNVFWFMLSKTKMSSVFYAFKDFNVFCLLRFQKLQHLQSFTLWETSISSALCFTRQQCLMFDSFKTSMSFTFMLYKTSMSSILRFIGLQGPLFGVVRLQCPFSFLVSLLLFSLTSGFE